MKLPASVQEIAEVIGEKKALFLVRHLPCYSASSGGRREVKRPLLYVPKKLSDDHELVKLLGRETALQLVEGFGGEMLKPASCRRWAKTVEHRQGVQKLRKDGMLSSTEIARIMNITARHVRNIVREINAGEMTTANDNTGQD